MTNPIAGAPRIHGNTSLEEITDHHAQDDRPRRQKLKSYVHKALTSSTFIA